MAEANSGKGKITIEVEVNEALMDITKECMTARARASYAHELVRDNKRMSD